MKRLILTVAAGLIASLVGLATQPAMAVVGICHGCGCAARCDKVCRLICEEKEVEVTCYGCDCETFCVPGKSRKKCSHCEEVCADCKPECGKLCKCDECPQSMGQSFHWNEYDPACAKTRTRKVLMQKTVVMKVPSYKWVVEDLCPYCEANCGCEVDDDADVPPPPVSNAKVIRQRVKPAISAQAQHLPQQPGMVIPVTGYQPLSTAATPTDWQQLAY
jgi:hypothetical protein